MFKRTKSIEKRLMSIENNMKILIRKIESINRFKSEAKLKKSKSLVFLYNNLIFLIF